MHGNSARENRETLSAPEKRSKRAGWRRCMNQKSSMNVGRESDGREVPAKSLNKDGRSSAEGSEGRRSAKENIEQTITSQTQSWAKVLSGLRGVREAARNDKRLQFTALLRQARALN